MGLFDKNKKSGKKTEKNKKKATGLTESSASLPVKGKKEKKHKMTDVERRQNALAFKRDPEYNKEYMPYVDPVEIDEETVKNAEYEKIAGRYRIAKWAVIILLILYSIFMFFNFRDRITLENFRYLMRNVDFDIETGINLRNDIIYDADPDNMFVKYRDYLALIGKSSLKIYDSSGMEAYSEKISFTSPAVCTSSKYMLIYDRQGGGYSVYSYFSREFSEEMSHPVCAAAMSDSGIYAVASVSNDYDGVVYIYNENFKLINRVFKNRAVSSLAVTDDGSEVLICAYGTESNGNVSAEITALPTATDDSRLRFTLDGIIPYDCGYLENGGFYIISADGIRIYKKNGSEKSFYSFGSAAPVKYMADIHGFALLFSDKNDSGRARCVMLDENGRVTLERDAGYDIVSSALDGEYLYLLYSDRLVRLSPERISEFKFNTPVNVCEVCADGDVFVCTSTAVIIPEWEDGADRNK